MRNYATENGNQIYSEALRLCENKFPLYVEELKGLADGSGVPFYKVRIDWIVKHSKIKLFGIAFFSPS